MARLISCECTKLAVFCPFFAMYQANNIQLFELNYFGNHLNPSAQLRVVMHRLMYRGQLENEFAEGQFQ